MRVASRDGVGARGRGGRAGFDFGARNEAWIRLIRKRHDANAEPELRRGGDEIFERASETQVKLPPERVEASEIPIEIGEHVDAALPDVEPPRLCVVRIRRQN